MYLFLGCQSSILVDRPGELAGAGTPHRSSGPGAFLAILIGRGIPTRAAAHTSDVFVERVFQVLQEGGQARSKILERATGIEPVSEAWEASILPLYDARSVLKLAKETIGRKLGLR